MPQHLKLFAGIHFSVYNIMDERKIIAYLMENFMKSLTINGSIFEDTQKHRERSAYFWAKRRYLELSESTKKDMLKKIDEMNS